MKRLVIVLLVLFGLILSPSGGLTDDFEMVTRPHDSERGWYPIDDDGYNWVYQGGDGTMIGRCWYSFIRYNGAEQWRGIFYHRKNDYLQQPYITTEHEGLNECVDWVENFARGGYYT